MDWKDKTKEELLKHSISIGLALIALLSLVIWQAVPSSVWGSISEATPKRVLWALLGLEAIAIFIVAALALNVSRKRIHTPPTTAPKPGPEVLELRKLYGVLWDTDHNPLCPVDETLMSVLMRHRLGYDILICPRCRANFPLRDQNRFPLTLSMIREHLEKQEISTKPFRMFGVQWDDKANPLCPACECLMPIHHQEQTEREGGVDILWCPRCKTLFSLWTDEGVRTCLFFAKPDVEERLGIDPT